MKEITVKAVDENLGAIQDFISVELESIQCPIKICRQFSIVAEELFANIAHYAYTGEAGFAVVRLGINGKEITLEFEDMGLPYNPLEKPDPDITASAEERPIGGLGVYMVKKIMDTVRYCHDGGTNKLIMTKDM